MARVRDRVELVAADVRDIPATALDGIDGVIHLAGLSNDPTAEYDPEANWQMNAIATEALGSACVERGVERLVFASSCSLYDGLPPGMHDETAPMQPRGAYATSKHYGEQALLELRRPGPLPGDPPQRHRLRVQPAHALRPRGQHLRQGRPAARASLSLHGGGWMWRPLVDVHDVSDAHDRRLRGARRPGQRRDLQRRALELPDPRAGDAGGGLRPAGGPRRSRCEEAPAPKLMRDYECSNAKLSGRLGFIPTRSVVEADLRPPRRRSTSATAPCSPTRATTTSAGSSS